MEIDYAEAWRRLGRPQTPRGVPVPVMAGFLRRHGMGLRRHEPPIWIIAAAYLRSRRTHILAIRVRRHGAFCGHYTVVRDGVLLDVDDCRDGVAIAAWSSR